jgi:L-fuconolactonase
MRKIDAHQHFWKYNPVRDEWINDDMKQIQRDFLPADLEPLLMSDNFEGCVVVQSDQSPAENIFQLGNTVDFDFIKGVVGWVDLKSEKLREELDVLSQHKKLKGFRHVLQGEHPDFMLDPLFKKGIVELSHYEYTYDLLLFPQHLPNAEILVREHPYQNFVLDHLAKPRIKSGEIDGWKKDIVKLASHSNVCCKISGMITEADWTTWKPENFTPYMDVIFEAFGSKRVMFGSDWPVCLVAGTYDQVVSLAEGYVSRLSADEQAEFWGLNAIDFYKLN